MQAFERKNKHKSINVMLCTLQNVQRLSTTHLLGHAAFTWVNVYMEKILASFCKPLRERIKTHLNVMIYTLIKLQVKIIIQGTGSFEKEVVQFQKEVLERGIFVSSC